jgi:hypothetical protein
VSAEIIIYDKDSPTQLIAADVSITTMRERWLHPCLEQSPPRVTALNRSIKLLCRVFWTYHRIMSRKMQLPPFVETAIRAGVDGFVIEVCEISYGYVEDRNC